MADEGIDKRLTRYLIITFIIVVACVGLLEVIVIPLAIGVVSSLASSLNAIQAFLMAQSALVFAIVPVVLGGFVYSRLVIRRLSDELEAADKERRQHYAQRNLMLSDMAHDLRTPVMGISSLARALEDGMVEDDATRQRYLRSIVAKSDKMGELATMLFEYIKLESKGFELNKEKIDLPQLLLNEAAALYSDAEDAGMELIVEVSEEPAPIFADRAQIARVVSNLLSNAMRHNTSGTRIVLALVRRAGVAEIVVADTGQPIEGDPRELFEPFARGDAARAGGGSGLGLSIAKTIVDMHGYSLNLQQPYGTYTKAFIVGCAIDLG